MASPVLGFRAPLPFALFMNECEGVDVRDSNGADVGCLVTIVTTTEDIAVKVETAAMTVAWKMGELHTVIIVSRSFDGVEIASFDDADAITLNVTTHENEEITALATARSLKSLRDINATVILKFIMNSDSTPIDDAISAFRVISSASVGSADAVKTIDTETENEPSSVGAIVR